MSHARTRRRRAPSGIALAALAIGIAGCRASDDTGATASVASDLATAAPDGASNSVPSSEQLAELGDGHSDVLEDCRRVPGGTARPA